MDLINTEDETERRRLMDALATYNDEDLKGMLAVYRWLETRTA